MVIRVSPTAANQSLGERWVGVANNQCTFPGIEQCFAVVGFRNDGMICTHVTPGTTKQEMSDTFQELKNLGGKKVMSWYILGPRSTHFSSSTAIWTSEEAIKKTFKDKLSNKHATFSLLDSSIESRIQIADLDRVGQTRNPRGLDIRVENKGVGPGFSYRPLDYMSRFPHVRYPWVEFNLTKFIRF